jgi:hypothetical protein
MPTDGNYYFGSRAGRASQEWLRSIDRPTGSEITTGNIGKLSDHAASVDAIIAKIDASLADLNARLDEIERRAPKKPRLLRERQA